MKKELKAIMSFLLSFALVANLAIPTTASAKVKVKLNKTKTTLTVGKTITLKLKNNKKKVKWSSSNQKIATVSKKGKVKAKKKGKATITAKVGKKKYKCKITVKAKKTGTNHNVSTKNPDTASSPAADSTKNPVKTMTPSADTTDAPGTTPEPGSATNSPGTTPEPGSATNSPETTSTPTDNPASSSKPTTSPTSTPKIDVSRYSYSITPLTDNICSYFYVKTDNPDPESFDFIDEDTIYTQSGKCTISLSPTKFADVKYEDEEILRVKDGYIFQGANTDGGQLSLESTENGVNKKTEITVTIPELKSQEDYLISEYTNSDMTFFEKMTAVQNGLEEICLYSGAYVLGELRKSTTSPYYGLSTSPHADQTFYIQNPYSRSDNKAMLISTLYPFRLDSVGFPSEMSIVAKKLEPSAICAWNSYYHWLIDVSYNGETHSYGGQGNGGGQGVTQNMVKYVYSFDGTAGDAYAKNSWSDIRSIIEEYGAMTVVEEGKDVPELTWKDVCNTVGTDGSYVRLVLINSIFGGGGIGYTFLYSDGSSTYPGYFSDAWYDGRYFNSHEFFEKGTTFDDEVASTATIVMKDVTIPFPDAPEGKKYSYDYKDINTVSEYNPDTGVWSGFTRYYYDSSSKTWVAGVYTRAKCFDSATREYSYIDDEDFKNACTLTLEDVKTMGIDKNANVDPKTYYIYDMTEEPGTKVN